MKKVGIIGLGLIGGSLAKALKAKYPLEIAASNRSEQPLLDAFNDGIIDKYSLTVNEIFEGCDIVFICTPVAKIAGYIESLMPFIPSGCILTDVGSTKNNIYEQALKFEDICFIGGHPMAGSEKTGYKASTDYLFENAYYIITPLPSVPAEKIKLFCGLIERIGAIPITTPPDKHDFAVAAISHLPHIIAGTLVNTVKGLETDDKLLQTLASGGFRDITRIASGSPEMWHSICTENKNQILNALTSFKNCLNGIEGLIAGDNDGVYSFFESAKDFRDSIDNRASSQYIKSYALLIDIVDRPGSIATVATLLSVNNINIKNIGIVNNREYEGGIMQILLESETDMKKSILLLTEMNFTIYKK